MRGLRASCATTLLLGFVFMLGTPSPSLATTSLMLIGDSISLGVVSAPVGPSWAQLLEERGLEISNVACGGASAQDWDPHSTSSLESCPPIVNLYADRALPSLPTDIVTVLLGALDAFYASPTEAYARNLRAITSQLLLDGAGRVVLMTAPRIFSSIDPAVNERLSEFREEVIEICSEEDSDRISCGPDLYRLLGPEHFSPTDGSHPNAAGHRLIADALWVMVPEAGKASSSAVALLQLALLARWKPTSSAGRAGR